MNKIKLLTLLLALALPVRAERAVMEGKASTGNSIFVSSTSVAVGIGTISPATALGVVGTVSATAFSGPLTGTVTGNVTGDVTGHASQLSGTSANQILFGGGANGFQQVSTFTVSGGNVGIGTTSPGALLDVNNGANTSPAQRMIGTSNTFGDLETTGASGSVGAYIRLRRSGSTKFLVGLGPISGNDVFEVGTASTLLFSVDGSGNIHLGGSGGTEWYYCVGSTGGSQDGDIHRGNGNAAACASGTWTAFSPAIYAQ